MKKTSDNNNRRGYSTSYYIDLQKNGLFVIICIFLTIIIIKLLLSTAFYAPFISDESVYTNETKILSNGTLYPHMGQQPPLYLFFLSIAYIISDDNTVAYHIMLIIGCIASSTIIFPAFFILRKYVESLYAILGAVAVMTCLALNYFSFIVMQENLYIPLMLFSVLAIIEAFDTSNLKWQIIAGASIACLEMTKSIGQIAEIAFVATIVIYIFINRKKGIISVIKSKAAMIITFLLLFSAWHLFLNNVDYINALLTGNTGKTSIGSTYNTAGMSLMALLSIKNLYDFALNIQAFINHIDYLLLASFMALAVVFFFFITELNKKLNLGTGFKVGELFIFQLILFSIIGVTIITISLRPGYGDFLSTIGRYTEAVVPPVILLGLIYVCNIETCDFKRNKYTYLISLSIIIIFFMFTNSTTYNMFTYDQILNNPSTGFFYNMKESGLLSFSLVVFMILSFTLFYLSLNNKKFITLLLIFMIISSIFMSILPYQNNVKYSNLEKTIKKSLLNGNDETIIIIDNNLSHCSMNNSSSYNSSSTTLNQS